MPFCPNLPLLFIPQLTRSLGSLSSSRLGMLTWPAAQSKCFHSTKTRPTLYQTQRHFDTLKQQCVDLLPKNYSFKRALMLPACENGIPFTHTAPPAGLLRELVGCWCCSAHKARNVSQCFARLSFNWI